MPELEAASRLEHLLSMAVEQALETMCFTAVFGSLAVGEITCDLAAELTFRGDAEGTFRIGLSRDAATSIATSFLATDEAETNEEQIEMVICELANIICGSALSHMKPQGLFHLQSPRRIPEFVHSEIGATEGFELETGQMVIHLHIAEHLRS
jgi:chemotaxis protein CheY-P-specific phosphatase CheC